MLRVAIVGCGKIADSHVSQINRIGTAEIVAVCDSEPLMARQLSERFRIPRAFSDLRTMLREIGPDVVHITTPPQSHFEIAKCCLEYGCHVYVEKPFTLFADHAKQLIVLAGRTERMVTVGHDDQFSHVARRMRELVRGGFLGGRPVHMESYYGYELGSSAYVNAVLKDKTHWVRKLPGKLLQNVISHGIARIAEFMTSESPQVLALGFTSPFLQSMGEREIIDELRVVISEHDCTTAYFTFSSQMRPSLHQFRIYGRSNGLLLDQDQDILIKLQGRRRKSYLEKFVSPCDLAGQHVSNAMLNAKAFLASDFHMKTGMKYLIQAFYQAIESGAPPPIGYDEIIRTAMIMDSIFRQLDTHTHSGVSLFGPRRQHTAAMIN